MKKSILICAIASIGLMFTAKASPPVRDVGKVILVEDQNPASLTELAFTLNAELNAELQSLIILEPTAVYSFANVAKAIVKPLELSGEVAVRDTGELKSYSNLSHRIKSTGLIKEKIFVYNCCIRQCTGETVAAV